MKKNLIINFHVVKDPVWFENVILLLKSLYTLVDMSFFEDKANYQSNKGLCHITFDDGERTFYTNAYPVLKKHIVPVTVFVSPKVLTAGENFWFQEIRGYNEAILINIIANELFVPVASIHKINADDLLKCLPISQIHKIIAQYQKDTNTLPKACFNMNLKEMLEVEKSGLITIGAHTVNHPILSNETDENSFKEITQSITGLEQLIGHSVKYFAYPNGGVNEDFGSREIHFLEQNNIKIAVSLEAKFIDSTDNHMAFPRFGLSYGRIAFVKLKLIAGSLWTRLKTYLTLKKPVCRNEIQSILKKNRINRNN